MSEYGEPWACAAGDLFDRSGKVIIEATGDDMLSESDLNDWEKVAHEDLLGNTAKSSFFGQVLLDLIREVRARRKRDAAAKLAFKACEVSSCWCQPGQECYRCQALRMVEEVQ